MTWEQRQLDRGLERQKTKLTLRVAVTVRCRCAVVGQGKVGASDLVFYMRQREGRLAKSARDGNYVEYSTTLWNPFRDI